MVVKCKSHTAIRQVTVFTERIIVQKKTVQMRVQVWVHV